MNRQELLIRIKNLVQSSDRTMAMVAKYIFKHSKHMTDYSTIHLGRLTNTSPATITRFCKYLGLSGFRELVKILSSEEEVRPNHQNDLLTDSLKIHSQIDEIISETAYLIDENNFYTLISDLVEHPNNVLLIGYGESGQFLRMLSSRLLRLGIQIRYFSQVEDMSIAASLVDKSSIILALSLSGSTKMVLDLVTIAKARHAKIYSITKYDSNPLKKISDINFPISYDSNNLLISKTQRYAIFFMLDLIFEKIVSLKPKKYHEILANTKHY